MVRGAQIFKGSVAGQITHVVAFTIQTIMAGTVFFWIPNTAVSFCSRGSVLYLFAVPSLIPTSSLLTLYPSPVPFFSLP